MHEGESVVLVKPLRDKDEEKIERFLWIQQYSIIHVLYWTGRSIPDIFRHERVNWVCLRQPVMSK